MTIGDGSSTVDVAANTTYTLQCAATGARPPASLSWRSLPAGANDPVPAQSTVVQTTGKLSTTTGSLTISPTVGDDGHQYSCLATNNATIVSSVTASVRLNVVCKSTWVSNVWVPQDQGGLLRLYWGLCCWRCVSYSRRDRTVETEWRLTVLEELAC